MVKIILNRKGVQVSIEIEPDKNPYKTQGRILKACRKIQEWTQEEIAIAMQVNRSSVCRWESKGCRDWLTMCRLIKVLGQDPGLFSDFPELQNKNV